MTVRFDHTGVYGIATIDSARKMLVVRKARGPYSGLFDLPGGSPEKNETSIETLTREVREETGLDVQNFSLVGNATIHVQYFEGGQQIYLNHRAIFFSVIEFISVNAFDSDETREDVAGFRWFAIDDLNARNSSPLVQCALKFVKNKMQMGENQSFHWRFGANIERS